MDIPRIIHQTYSTSNLPAKVRENIEFVKKINPGWEYRFYDDYDIHQFIKRNFQPAIYQAYCRINPAYGAARADFFRYLLIFRVGGVYLDIKSSVLIPLDQVILPDDQYILSHWPNEKGSDFEGWGMHREIEQISPYGEFQNWHVIARPEHPFLHHAIVVVLDNIMNYAPDEENVGQVGVFRTTGPIAYTLSIYPVIRKHPCRRIRSHLELGLQYNVAHQAGNVSHRNMFKTHYSALREPVIFPIHANPVKGTGVNGIPAHAHLSTQALRSLFINIYAKDVWDGGSGPGSRLENIKNYHDYVQTFLREHNIKSIVDCGCGDWQSTQYIDLTGISYTGVDIVPTVIETNQATYGRANVTFVCGNFSEMDLPCAELAICKDALQHLPNANVADFLRQLHKFHYVLITNDLGENAARDTILMSNPYHFARLDISLEPFLLQAERVCEMRGDKVTYLVTDTQQWQDR